jgi:hypothetical protein
MHMYEDVFHIFIIHLKTFNIQQFYDRICYYFTSRLDKVISLSTLLCFHPTKEMQENIREDYRHNNKYDRRCMKQCIKIPKGHVTLPNLETKSKS